MIQPDATEPGKPSAWFVYILDCSDGTLYTGITTEPERRLEEHNIGDKGAKYTKNRRPVEIIYLEEADSRASASKREYAIKQMSREQKQQLISNKRKVICADITGVA